MMEENIEVKVDETKVDESSTKMGETTKQEKTYSQKEVDELLKGKFTQEQVNKMIEDRLKRAKTPQPTPKVDNGELTQVKAQVGTLQLQLAKYEKELALKGYQINDEDLDYVDYKVLHMTGKDKSYAQALQEYMEGEGQRFLKKPDTSSFRPKNVNKDNEDAILEERLAIAMGTKRR